ncbi:MAG: hypothetical protein AB7J40_05300 [Candidatus Altimarinota bacterium]
MKNSIAVKIFGVLAIIVLILTAMAPVFYAFAPRYEFVPPDASSDTPAAAVESVTIE